MGQGRVMVLHQERSMGHKFPSVREVGGGHQSEACVWTRKYYHARHHTSLVRCTDYPSTPCYDGLNEVAHQCICLYAWYYITWVLLC